MRSITEQWNAAFRSLGPEPGPPTDAKELPPPTYEQALAAGWVEHDGCWLLDFFFESYYGSREDFEDRTGFEAAANGRAVPDDDLPSGADRAALIARRGLTFARRALARLPQDAPGVTAFVSVGPTGFDESLFTGSVTFCADHEDERPYLADAEDFDEGVALVRSGSAQRDRATE